MPHVLDRYPKSLAVAIGLAAATGFAPLGRWPVTLGAIALLLVILRDAPSARAAFTRGWLFGVGQFALGLNWIAHAFDFQDAMPHWLGYVAVVALSLYLAVYPGVAAWLAWRVARSPQGVSRGVLTLAFAAAWIVIEYARATLFTGFAWNPLAAVAVGLPLADATRWIGTYGLSGLIVVLSGLLWWLGAWARDAILSIRGRDPAHLAAAAGVSLVLIIGVYGTPWPGRTAPPPAVREIGPSIRIVQPNLSLAAQRDSEADDANVAVMERLSGSPDPAPRLILWPEGAVPWYLAEESWARGRLSRMLGPRDVLMTGGSTLIYDKEGNLAAAANSVFALDARGETVARYDKRHLVPYGEYLPMRPVLSAIGLARLVESEVDFIPGQGSLTTAIPGFGRVGFQLCYEIIFSGEVVDRANRPDFIFNPSIDAWFGTWGPPQHLAQARLRAIEEGLPVVRSTTTGISAVIDADGRALAALPLNKAGAITLRVPPAAPPTLFARFGNTIPLLLAFLLAAGAIAPRFRRR
jgi:apolipoprotein N-acyltransferase